MSKLGATRTKRVLLAEDDPICSDLVCCTLEVAGFQISVVADGAAARSELAASAFDIAIMDVNLPGVDGLTLLAETRAGGPNIATPIVVMTGENGAATTLSAYRLGATSFMAKPIDWPEFAGTIELILRGSERQAEDAATWATVDYWLQRGNQR